MWAKQSPRKTALLDSDARLSYEDLDTGCAQLAAVLRRQGVHPGDAVLILVPLSVKFYLAVTAVLHLGAIPVL
ncbi:MAG TPA: AMP-binding protein, partial [Terriglobales bacterium]|nr:AMP-binding protein [Terriglobales bacterium]